MHRFALLPSQIYLTINPSSWCSLKVIRGQYNANKDGPTFSDFRHVYNQEATPPVE